MKPGLELGAREDGVGYASCNENDKGKGGNPQRCEPTKEQLRRADVGWLISFLVLAYIAFYGS